MILFFCLSEWNRIVDIFGLRLLPYSWTPLEWSTVNRKSQQTIRGSKFMWHQLDLQLKQKFRSRCPAVSPIQNSHSFMQKLRCSASRIRRLICRGLWIFPIVYKSKLQICSTCRPVVYWTNDCVYINNGTCSHSNTEVLFKQIIN